MSPELQKIVDRSDNGFEAMFAAMVYCVAAMVVRAAEVMIDTFDV